MKIVKINKMKLNTLYLFLIMFAITSLFIPNSVFADVVSPKKQVKLGISEENVFCKQGYFKVIRTGSETPACLKLDTVMKLVNKGWAKPIDTMMLDEMKKIAKQTIGQVNLLAVSKQPGETGRERTVPLTTGYNVVFEVCANEKPIRAATALISSDSEVKQAKLPFSVNANSCNISAVKIKAANSDSITGELVNKGRLTTKLMKMEENVEDLRQKLKTERTNLAMLVNESPQPENFDKKKDIIIENIVKIRKEFNTANQELNRYLFALNVGSNTRADDIKVPKTHTGVAIEGALTDLLSVSKSISEPGAFDVVFEVCAGKDILRVPIVVIQSDVANKAVRLADKVSPNSCQVTGSKINATSSDSITVGLGDTAGRSATISDLEKKITELEADIKSQKESIRNLTHLAPRPADFNEQVDPLVNKIVELRVEIHELKAKLYLLLNQSYE